MLRRISKSGSFLQVTIFIVILVLLWVPAFVNPVKPVRTSADGPLFELLLNWLDYFTSYTVGFALVLILLQSVILFYVFQSNGFFKRSNFLPAIIILLAYSWNGNYQTMHAILPAGLFIVLALNSIMAMYGRHAAYHQVFNASLALGIASLFFIPMTYLLLAIWFTLISYRISSWREYAVSITGYALPFIYYISWLYLNDNLIAGLNKLSDSLVNFSLFEKISVIPTLWLCVSAFIMAVTSIAVLNAMNDKLINIRRRAWVLFNFSFTNVILIIITGLPILSANYLFVIPMSFFITGSLTNLKRSFGFELLIIGYFLLFVAMRLYLVMS